MHQKRGYLIGQKFVGQICRNFGLMSKIVSDLIFCPKKILSNEILSDKAFYICERVLPAAQTLLEAPHPILAGTVNENTANKVFLHTLMPCQCLNQSQEQLLRFEAVYHCGYTANVTLVISNANKSVKMTPIDDILILPTL